MFPFWATKREVVGLIVRAIIFLDFQPVWSLSKFQRHRRTDGQTDRQTDDMQSRYRAMHYRENWL